MDLFNQSPATVQSTYLYEIITKPETEDCGDIDEEGDTDETSSSHRDESEFDPMAVVSPEQLEAYNYLKHPVWVFDFHERRNRWANGPGLDLWNAPSLEEFQNRDMTQMSDVAIARTQEMQMLVDRGQSQELQWTFYPKGQAVTVHATATGIRLSEDEDHTCLLLCGVPLSNERLLDESIRGIEILRHLPMAVCQFDMEGGLMFENQAAKFPLHHGDEELSVDSLDSGLEHESSSSRFAGPDHFLQRFVDAEVGRSSLLAIKTHDEVNLEAELRSKDGPQWSAIQLRKTCDPVTKKSVILFSAQDKSDAVMAKKEREASIQKSEFLAIMAHEIRTPLHQVIGFIDLLDKTRLDVEQKSFVKLLKSSAQGLMTVISDVLDYSKLEAGKMKIESIPYEPLGVVFGTMAAVRAGCEEKGVELTKDWDKSNPFRLLGDPNRLRQVLLNLLSNAVKFTPAGGKIQVRAHTMDSITDDCMSISGVSEAASSFSGVHDRTIPWRGPWIKFVVEDSGIGICQDHQSKIFQKYQQANLTVARNFGGTGLGLSICQQLVEAMGGKIGVTSTLGKGSMFWFLLPMKLPAEGSLMERKPSLDEVDARSLKVLIAEDNRINQKLMSNMLRRMGHTYQIADNGSVAIEMVQQDHFDVVLMDIQMPVMDGLEATRRLRAMGFTDLPILGLTASMKHSDYRELGFDDWLGKPVPMNELKMKLQTVGLPQYKRMGEFK
eukprot:Nitzschia sp. Nitz4//scaffold148_size54725//5350//7512//NITZ4_006651-RA/size54725-processed-gene-0.7-mRNA-1//1//CDS//3329536727//1615//frame0